MGGACLLFGRTLLGCCRRSPHRPAGGSLAYGGMALPGDVGLCSTRFNQRTWHYRALCSLNLPPSVRFRLRRSLSTPPVPLARGALSCSSLVEQATSSSLSPSAKSFDPACSIGARCTVVLLTCGTGHLQFAFAFGEVPTGHTLSSGAHKAHALFRCPQGTHSLPVPNPPKGFTLWKPDKGFRP